MGLRLIIDGYNLISTLSSPGNFDMDMEAEREELLKRLEVYRRVKRVKITVVFDGTATGNLRRGADKYKGIKVIFSRAGEEADAIIKDMAREGGTGLTIVTSDRDVAVISEKAGAVVISSTEFAELLYMAEYTEMKGLMEDDEEEDVNDKKKGPSRRNSRKERKKAERLKKL